MAGIAIIDC